MNANHHPHVQGIDIAGKTLDQLEKEIISRVLKEEDYNQTAVANGSVLIVRHCGVKSRKLKKPMDKGQALIAY